MTVYTLTYYNLDISDCNGVFSSYENAKAAFEEDCERCADIWKNVEIQEEIEDPYDIYWATGSFLLTDSKLPTVKVEFDIAPQYIDERFADMSV